MNMFGFFKKSKKEDSKGDCCVNPGYEIKEEKIKVSEPKKKAPAKKAGGKKAAPKKKAAKK